MRPGRPEGSRKGETGMRPTTNEYSASAAMAIAEPHLRDQIYDALRDAPVGVVSDLSAIRDIGELVAGVARAQPDVLLLGPTRPPVDLGEAIRRVAESPGAPRIVVVNDCASPDSILDAMRAGADEYLYPPFGDEFRAVLAGIAGAGMGERGGDQPAGSVIGFVSGKGGCGATTLACWAALHLRREAKREVLVADLDPCAGLCAMYLRSSFRHTLSEALEHRQGLDLTLWKALVADGPDGLDVLAASSDPWEYSGNERTFQFLLHFWRSHYDFTILDLGHGMAPAMYGLAQSLDQLVVVTTEDAAALRMTKQVVRGLNRATAGADRVRLAVNRTRRRGGRSISELERSMDCPVYGAIPLGDDIEPAYSDEIRTMRLDSAAAAAVGVMTAKLTGLPAAKRERKFAFLGAGG